MCIRILIRFFIQTSVMVAILVHWMNSILLFFLCSSLLSLRFEKCESSEFFTCGGALPPCPPPLVYTLSSIQSIKNQPCSMFIPWFVDLSMFANLYATSIRNFNSFGSFSLFWYCIYLLILYYPSILSFIWLSLNTRNKSLINHAEDDNCFILIWLARWKKWNEMNYKKESPKIH